MSLFEDVPRNTRMAIAILAQGLSKSLEQAIEREHSTPNTKTFGVHRSRRSIVVWFELALGDFGGRGGHLLPCFAYLSLTGNRVELSLPFLVRNHAHQGVPLQVWARMLEVEASY